jgi:hypothetical protein
MFGGLETVLDLIDANLASNRDEVLQYIQENEDHVANELHNKGQVDIPTSAGTVTIQRKDIAA